MLKDKNIFNKTQPNLLATPLMFIAALFIIAKTWKLPKYPLMDERVKKLWRVCVCVYIYTQEYMYVYTGMHSFILPFLFFCSHQVWAHATGGEGEAVSGDLQRYRPTEPRVCWPPGPRKAFVWLVHKVLPADQSKGEGDLDGKDDRQIS